jgi:hypothetical protein
MNFSSIDFFVVGFCFLVFQFAGETGIYWLNLEFKEKASMDILESTRKRIPHRPISVMSLGKSAQCLAPATSAHVLTS